MNVNYDDVLRAYAKAKERSIESETDYYAGMRDAINIPCWIPVAQCEPPILMHVLGRCYADGRKWTRVAVRGQSGDWDGVKPFAWTPLPNAHEIDKFIDWYYEK